LAVDLQQERLDVGPDVDNRCTTPHIVDLAMIHISVTHEAFEAIVATLPLGSVGYERELNAQGERRIWIEAAVADRLTAMRGPGGELQRRDLAAGRDRGEGRRLRLRQP
jgi:hypothetical protein